MDTLRRLGVALLAVAAVSGCAKTVTGSPVPGTTTRTSRPPVTTTSKGSGELTAKDALGDLTTLDPCSLADLDVLRPFGTVKPTPSGGFDECMVDVSASGDSQVTVYFGRLDFADSLTDLASKPTEELTRGLELVDYSVDATYCTKLLAFPDDITLSVDSSTGSESVDACKVVDAVVESVVEVVTGGDAEHLRPRSGSLIEVDPCDVVPADAPAAVPNLGSAKPKGTPGKHACTWSADAAPTAPRLRASFGPGTTPEASGEGASADPIAGRPSVVRPTPNVGQNVYCSAETGHVPFSAGDGQTGLVEVAYLYVRLPEGQLQPACDAVKAIAAATWPKLPKA